MEATSLAKDLEKLLVKFEHNTISYDGWSSSGHAEIYTVHITTPWPRQSYLVEGLQLMGQSTDAETLFNGIAAVCKLLLGSCILRAILKSLQVIIQFVAWCISIVLAATKGNRAPPLARLDHPLDIDTKHSTIAITPI